MLDICSVTDNISKEEKNSTNTKLLDMYLKYNIIDRKQLNDIIVTGKLKSIENVNKYRT